MKKFSRHPVSQKRFQRMLQHFESCGYTLYEYQEEGVHFMSQRETDPAFQGAGLLCDEPGLGKTIQTVATMWLNPQVTLLVLPNCVVSQWRDFLQLIFPEIGIYIHHGLKRCLTIDELKDELTRSKIVITTYGTFDNLLPRIKWGRIVYDEIHYLRNSNTNRSRVACEMKAKYYWGLSGTPVNNKIEDLRTLYDVLHFPSTLLNSSEATYYDSLNKRYILRRTKKDVSDINPLLRLPDLTIRTVTTRFIHEEEREVHADIMRQIYERYGDNPNWDLVPLEWYMRMRQACIHPRLVESGLSKKWGFEADDFEEAVDVKSTKFEIIREMLKCHSDEKTLIFCYFREEMDILERILVDHMVYRIDGSKSIAEREIEIRDFKEERRESVMLIQIAAGSVGMNLQFASRVYITSPHYNPSVEIQAIARAHRIGQKAPVEVTKLVIVNDGFIEDNILERQVNKRELMAMVLEDEDLKDNGEREELHEGIYNTILEGIRA